MNPAIINELQEWRRVFQQELEAQLEQLRDDKDVYGFAVELPEDPGNLGIATAIGRESKLKGEKPRSAVWLDRRYSPVEWEFLPNAQPFHQTHEKLEQLARYRELPDDAAEDDEARDELLDTLDEEFLTALYNICLQVMAECNAKGSFGHIWYKVLFMSDGEHPILQESFKRLNTGRALKEAAPLFDNE